MNHEKASNVSKAGSVYRVEVDTEGCKHCHEGKYWCVVGPDGAAGGESFADEVDAEEHAVAMNAAYAEGRKGVNELADAMRAVIAESDRDTDAYIRARALLAAIA